MTQHERWKIDILKGGLISLVSVRAFEAKLRGRTQPWTGEEELIELRQLNSRRVGDKRAMTAALHGIAAGEVRPWAWAAASPVGRLAFRLSDIRKFFGTPVLESGISLHQLTTVTGWKHESASNWINEGLLESESIMLRGQPCRVVMPAQLLQFSREFIPLADLAKLLGTRASAAAKHVPGLAFVGAKTLPNGVRRGGLVRLADLAKLAVVGARTHAQE